MILFDSDKATDLMESWGVDVLLPHTLLNAGYLSDHWKHELYTSLGALITFDTGEAYQIFVGLPRDRKIEPCITCRRGAEEGDMYNWRVWIKDKRIWGPDVVPRALNTPLRVDVVGPNPGQAQLGEIVCFDAGGSYRHYQSDLCFLVWIGEPSKALVKIHNGMKRPMDAVLEALRPGVPAPEVYRIGKTVYEQEGVEPYFEYVAHGIDRDVHEEPEPYCPVSIESK